MNWITVNQEKAKELFDSGRILVVCPNELTPESRNYPLIGSYVLTIYKQDAEDEFDKLVKSIESNICQHKELGDHLEFYAIA